MRIVTIFGGSGFLGRHIVQRLAHEGYGIRVATRRPELAGFLRPCGDVGQIVPVQANVRDEASIRRAVAGADAVINLTGILYERGRQTFYAVHVASADRIARAAADAGASHLLHVSAIGADAASPSDYARSKAAGEAAVREAFPTATVFRPSLVFGPEDDFFNRFASIVRLVPVLPVFFDGLPKMKLDGLFPHARVRRGHDAVSTGLRGGHRRGHPTGAGRRDGAGQDLRARRPLGLQLRRADGAGRTRDRPKGVVGPGAVLRRGGDGQVPSVCAGAAASRRTR